MEPKSSILTTSELACKVCGGTVPFHRPLALDMADAANWSALFDDQLNVRVACPHCGAKGSGFEPFVVFDECRLAMFYDGRDDPRAIQSLTQTLEPVFARDGYVAGRQMLPSVDVGMFDGDGLNLKAALLAGRFLDRHDSNITSLGARLRMYQRAGGRLSPDLMQQILDQGLPAMAPMSARERDAQVRSWLGDTLFDEPLWEANFSKELRAHGRDDDSIAQMVSAGRRFREKAVGSARSFEAETKSRAEAQALFERALAGTATYWLQLRNFSLRRTIVPQADAGIFGPGFEGTSGAVMTRPVDTDDPQEQIAQALSRTHPVLAIADGREWLLRPSPMLRMNLTDETWQAAATALVLKARGIVMVIQEVTDAIFFELDTLGLTARARDALIVFRQPTADDLSLPRIMAAMASASLTPPDPVPLASLQRCLGASGLFAGVISPEVDTPGMLQAVHAFMRARLADTPAPG